MNATPAPTASPDRRHRWHEPGPHRAALGERKRRYALAALATVARPLLAGVSGAEALPPAASCILAANHSSALDLAVVPLLVYTTCGRSVRCIVRPLLRNASFAHRVINRLLCSIANLFVSVVPYHTTIDKVAVCRAWLQAGRPLLMFPEGRMHTDANLRRPRTGTARLALLTGAPLVPIGIIGSGEVLAPRQLVPRLGRIRLVVGTPLAPPPAAADDACVVATLTAHTMQAISALCGKPRG